MDPAKNPPEGASRRRSKRPLMRIPIEVAGKDADGAPFSESTHTLVVSRDGARIALKSSLRAGDRIIITNTEREESCPFRVVGRTEDTYSDCGDWGVECLQPNRNFWGIYIPEITSTRAQGEGIDVLIECVACRRREMAQLSMDQYRTLSTESALTRRCAACGRDSRWEFGFADVRVVEARGPASNASPSALSPPGAQERRGARRFVAMLPLRMRNQQGKEEKTRTENLSKLGLCFLSDLVMEEGEGIGLAVGPDEDRKQELAARIAWRRPITGSTRSLYGVRLEEESP